MFNQQAEELAREMGTQDVLLKELYDSIEQEDNEKQKDYEFLKKQQIQINSLLDSYGIPVKQNGKKLSLFERIASALKQRMTA